MFVSEKRVLGVGLGAAQVRLANLVHDGWLSGASDCAYWGGMDHLLRAGPLGDLPGVSRLVRVQFLDPVYREDAMTLGVGWEAVGVTGGLFPVLDADIKLSAEGGQGTRVALTGCYRPPFGALGAGLDRMLMHTVATLTLRSLLTRLATALEGTAAAAGEKPVFWQRDTGPQTASD
ncbi:MAG TPA: hypothetical protein VF933_06440 [Streptosporangiaceae bacterium]